MKRDLPIVDGEKRLMSGSEDDWLSDQEQQDCLRLIQTGDPESVKIGKARLRYLRGRETLQDIDEFER